MITYIKGDATTPQAKGAKIIAHVCNNIGRWGSGFVVAVSDRWPQPEIAYRHWYKEGKWDGTPFELGQTQFVQVLSDIWIANMVAQEGIKGSGKGPPIRYPALFECLQTVGEFALNKGATVHMPRIGCSLAGGKWSVVEPLIQEALTDVQVFVYDFRDGTFNA